MYYAYMYYIHLIHVPIIHRSMIKRKTKGSHMFYENNFFQKDGLTKRSNDLVIQYLVKTVSSTVMRSFVLLAVIFILHDIFK